MTVKTLCITDNFTGKLYLINFDSIEDPTKIYDDFCEENNISYMDSDYMVVEQIVDERHTKEGTIV